METRANYALIGAFVVMSVVAILGFALWLGTSQLNRDYTEYDVVFQGPISLEEGASVRYIGIKVGEVESVRIDNRDASKVRARLRIDRSTPVKADSTAVIDFAGITGVTFVQITAGTDSAGPLRPAPNQDIAEIDAGPTPLAALFDGGAQIVEKVDGALAQAETLLTDENIAALSSTLRNIEAITADLAADDGAMITQATDTLSALERAGERLAVASDAATRVAGSVEGELETLNAELKLLVAELNSATGEATSTLAESKRAIAAATALVEGSASDTMAQTGRAAQELRQLTARLDRVVRDLEQNPQSLVVGNPRPYEKKR